MRPRMWRDIVLKGVRSGSTAAITSALALAACGWLERRQPIAPFNGPSQWLWGRQAGYRTKITWRHTALGYLIHHGAAIGWGVLHERLFGGRLSQSRRPPTAGKLLRQGLSTAAIAAFVDYPLTPKRLEPGFEKHMSPKSVVVVYAAFGIGLVALDLLKRLDSKRSVR
jgi:hypothetical protein